MPGRSNPPTFPKSGRAPLDLPTEEQAKIKKAAKAGLVNATILWWGAKLTGVPYFIACAFAEQETNGQSIYGHDGGSGWLFYGHGNVTPDNWATYLEEAERMGRRQGAGLFQQTSEFWQDKVDFFGGADVPLASILTTLLVFAEQREAGMAWHDIAKDYNGSEVYADHNDDLRVKWQNIIGV